MLKFRFSGQDQSSHDLFFCFCLYVIERPVYFIYISVLMNPNDTYVHIFALFFKCCYT